LDHQQELRFANRLDFPGPREFHTLPSLSARPMVPKFVYNNEMGQPELAAPAHQQAATILEAAARSDADPQTRYELARAYCFLAEAHHPPVGRAGAASDPQRERDLRKAIELLAALGPDPQHAPDQADLLVYAHHALGTLQQRAGQLDAAIESFEQAVAVQTNRR
jgi:tetratricopeptide (TPR) repeat protein